MFARPLLLALFALVISDAEAGSVEMLSKGSGGAPANQSCYEPEFVKGTREIVFTTRASNLAVPDADANEDVLVVDVKKHTFECVSVTDDDLPIAAPCYASGASTNGRYVAFLSNGVGIAPGVPGGDLVAYVRDRKLKTTRGIAFTSTGMPITDYLYRTRISPDGRYATFASDLANVVPGVPGGKYQTYLRDLKLGTTELISMDLLGGGGNEDTVLARVSSGGRYVFFSTASADIAFNDTNGANDLFVRDRKLDTITRLSVGVNGQLPGGIDEWDVSPNGRFVTFSAGDDYCGLGMSANDVGYWLDRKTGARKPIAIPSQTPLPWGTLPEGLRISANGKRVAFLTYGVMTADDVGNSIHDVFVCTPKTGGIARVTEDALGGTIDSDAYWPTIAGNGKRIAFETAAPDLVGAGANGKWQLFIAKP